MSWGDLRAILQYVPQFRGAIFVVAIDGEVIAHDNFNNLLLDLAVLHSLSVKLVLVHGASHQITTLAQSRQQAITSADGLGVTDARTLDLSEEAINNLSGHILQQFTSVGLRGATGTFLEAHPAGIIRGQDLEHTGSIEKVDIKALRALLEHDIIPVVEPLGYDGQGGILRLNSDAVALYVGIALKAQKILYINCQMLSDEQGQPIAELSVEEVKKRIATLDPVRDIATLSALKNAVRACENGVSRVHLLDGREDEVMLQELFSNEGVGTMIYADDYQKIRPARPSDITSIMSVISQSVMDEELLPRTRKDIKANLSDYYLMEIDGNLVGIVSVHLYAEHSLSELGCLFIRPSHENSGFGRKLVSFAEKRSRELGAQKIIALSTQAWRFFEKKCGYQEAEQSMLPPARLQKYQQSGRYSRIMSKGL
jgi:amino-acid N-acetyltransferase